MQHNPDKLSPEQVDVADGWRLLDEDEAGNDFAFKCSHCEAWQGCGWVGGCSGAIPSVTYRTKLTREDLRAARGLPPTNPPVEQPAAQGGGEKPVCPKCCSRSKVYGSNRSGFTHFCSRCSDWFKITPPAESAGETEVKITKHASGALIFDPFRNQPHTEPTGRQDGEKPTKVCLCGSSRWPMVHMAVMMEETLAGRIVIPMGCYGHADFPPGAKAATSDGDESTAVKQMLDRLHFAKIDLADEIVVVSVGSYFGDSTKREIAHAEGTGKKVRYLDFPAQPAASDAGGPTDLIGRIAMMLPDEVRALMGYIRFEQWKTQAEHQLHAHAASLQSENARLKERLARAETKAALWWEQFRIFGDTPEKARDGINQEYAVVVSECNEARADLAAARQELEGQSEKLKMAEGSEAELSRSHAKVEQQLTQLRNDFEQACKRKAELVTELASLADKLKEAQADRDKWQSLFDKERETNTYGSAELLKATDKLKSVEAERDAANKQIAMDTECIERIRTHGMQMELERDRLAAELAAEKESLQTAIEDGNRSRQIIYSMVDALKPNEGEHNIDCAKRVAAELVDAREDDSAKPYQVAMWLRVFKHIDGIDNMAFVRGGGDGADCANRFIDALRADLTAALAKAERAEKALAEAESLIAAIHKKVT